MDSLSYDYNGIIDQNNQFSGYFGRKPSSMGGATSMRFKQKAVPAQQMHEFPNMSAFAILDRRAEAKRENLSKSKSMLNEISKQKEKHQYDSYMSNVNTLNSMKKIFKDLCPVFESREGKEKEEARKLSKTRSMKADSKKRQLSKEEQGATIVKKKKMIKCIVDYEKDLKSFEAAWSRQPSSDKPSARMPKKRGQAIIVNP